MSLSDPVSKTAYYCTGVRNRSSGASACSAPGGASTPKTRLRWSRVPGLGYALREAVSIPLRAAELKHIRVPAWVLRHLLGSLRDGYRACVFEAR